MRNEGNPLGTVQVYNKDGKLVHTGRLVPIDPIDHGVATGEDYESEMEYREEEPDVTEDKE